MVPDTKRDWWRRVPLLAFLVTYLVLILTDASMTFRVIAVCTAAVLQLVATITTTRAESKR